MLQQAVVRCNSQSQDATGGRVLQQAVVGCNRKVQDATGSHSVQYAVERCDMQSYDATGSRRMQQNTCRCGLARRHLAWMQPALRYAPAPSQIETASERGCGQPHLAHGRLRRRQCQQHDEHGRILEWPTSAKPGAGRRPCEVQGQLGANRTADARSESLLRMACLNPSPSLPSLPNH